jgi:hypothetical protein
MDDSPGGVDGHLAHPRRVDYQPAIAYGRSGAGMTALRIAASISRSCANLMRAAVHQAVPYRRAES